MQITFILDQIIILSEAKRFKGPHAVIIFG